MLNTVIFDMYGVIMKESKGNFIPYVYQHFPETDRAYLVELFNQAGRGHITSHEFLSRLGFTGDLTAYEQAYLTQHLTFDAEFLPVVEKLHPHYSCGLFSNDVAEWSRYLRETYALDQYFDVAIVSGEVGCRKPEQAIYEILLRRVSCPPQDCVFIDNSVKNLRVAEALGLQTILFNRDHEEYDGHSINAFHELPSLLEQMAYEH
jgi:putative hydrolase of the HAD superfamily